MNAGHIVQSGAPTDIYDNPQDPFVADFVGGSNFLAAEVAKTGPSGVTLRHGDVMFTIPVASDLRPGEHATLVVRPENLRLARSGDGAGGLPGVISFVRPTGPMLEYEVETATGVRVKITAVRSTGLPPYPLGEAVRVELADPHACSIFRG
jgi:ABC-type Fe3+/spermidine/putrescine transport system ATPase subunit